MKIFNNYQILLNEAILKNNIIEKYAQARKLFTSKKKILKKEIKKEKKTTILR